MVTPPQPRFRPGTALSGIVLVFSVLFLALIISGLVAGAAALRSLRPQSDMINVRDEVLSSLAMPRVSSVEVTIPSWVATLARAGASMADIDPQAATALRAVKDGQLGVYELAERPDRSTVLAMLKVADGRLTDEGWTRMITVLEEGKCVAVYGLDSSFRPDKAMRVFIMVLDDHDLVIVSTTGRAEPLAEFASSAMEGLRL